MEDKLETDNLIDFLLRERTQKASDAISNVSAAYRLAEAQERLLLPLYSSKLSAGFESPASDHIEDEIDPNAYLVDKPSATMLFRISGDSMNKENIIHNDVVIANRALEWRVGDIVAAETPRGFTVKILGKGCLLPSSTNPIHKPIYLKDNEEVRVIAVITGGMYRLGRGMKCRNQ